MALDRGRAGGVETGTGGGSERAGGGGRRDEDDEDDEDDSEENNRKHYRLREMKIRVYNHTVEFKRNGALVVSALAS